jgi:tRNA threonylcarbamoyladenosine biosynthesis protein TsaB
VTAVRALAIETSSRTGSIAAVEDGRVVAEAQFEHGLQHAAQILPIIDRLCRGQGWTPADVHELYVSAGPGSFTGLRIGITLAKTFSLATGARLVAVPTVRVLAENAPPEARHVVLVLDAKRGQIFSARFERARGEQHASGEQRARDEAKDWLEREPAHLDTLATMLARAPRPVHLLGEGIPHHEKFVPRGDANVIVTPSESWRPQARVVAAIGARMARAGHFADPDRLAPTYLRKPEAEEKWEQRQTADNG